MVASISARGSAKAALAYYDHLQRDDYYTREGEPPGRWAGRGAERLSLDGPVAKAEFEAALDGRDPKTGEQLVQRGGRSRSHDAGWDMTFSAPKSASVLWALSEPAARREIKKAHRVAVTTAGQFLENEAAWCRRGKGGAIKEPTTGLLIANFDHHTSRALDPQLHTHSFIFNLASRHDGSWGAIVSKKLYQAQKQVGAVYRNKLASELERQGYRLDRQGDEFRVVAIPRHVERAFSKRRQAIEESAQEHGYKTAKGMELATLRTRRAKGDVKLGQLFPAWQAEALAMGFQLRQGRIHDRQHEKTDDSAGSKVIDRSASQTARSPRSPNQQIQARQHHPLPDEVTNRLQRLASTLQQPERRGGFNRINLKLRSRRTKDKDADIEIEL